MSGKYDAVVIGGGHNGLVCAAYLARSGRKVVVLEAREAVGGAAVTEEIAPGYRAPVCAHILHHLHPAIEKDLGLAGHGLALAARGLATVALDRSGRHLRIDGASVTRFDGTGVSEADLAGYGRLRPRLLKYAKALRPMLAETPPRLGTTAWSDRRTLIKLGWAIRRMGRADTREFLRIVLMNVADLFEDEIEDELLIGALAFDAVLGEHLGPRSPNTVLSLLYRLSGSAAGVQGALAVPKGGMGAVAEAMAAAASAAGAEIRTQAPVMRVLVEQDRTVGVALASGEEIRAPEVVSNADPKRTFLDLLGTEHLDAGFVRRVRNIRARGCAAKLNLALKGLPEIQGLPAEALGDRLVIAPSVGYLEDAFNPAKYGEFSARPALEITLPSVHDASLVPGGGHVLSAVVQYAPYGLKAGWDAARDRFAETVLDLLEAHAPGLRSLVVGQQLLTPLDLERRFQMPGGHWHHGELVIDQMFMLRPVPGAAQYETPVAGLFLCGAGAHPGGGVMGVAGMNAAKRIMAREAGR
jgi:phytoene dehydrogenase-like protein